MDWDTEAGANQDCSDENRDSPREAAVEMNIIEGVVGQLQGVVGLGDMVSGTVYCEE